MMNEGLGLVSYNKMTILKSINGSYKRNGTHIIYNYRFSDLDSFFFFYKYMNICKEFRHEIWSNGYFGQFKEIR